MEWKYKSEAFPNRRGIVPIEEYTAWLQKELKAVRVQNKNLKFKLEQCERSLELRSKLTKKILKILKDGE